MRAAAIQLEPEIADVAANLEVCERLADAAAAAGAELIALPEFFTTGIGFDPALADAAVAPDGEATQLMRALARRHGTIVGGSFLCRDGDGHVRNAYLLLDRDGDLLGRHDKDLPTMWENAFYVPGRPGDDGVIPTGPPGSPAAGAAVCWELMRSQTARRLRGRVDVVLAGSGWWSVPSWPPRGVTRRMEAANARTAATVAERFARLVGAPVVHAAHAGPLACDLPWTPVAYRGHFQGGAVIADASGNVLARRDRREGPGHAIADIALARADPVDPVPDSYWLHPRGPVAAVLWNVQRWHGRRWYERHVAHRPPLQVTRGARGEQVPVG